MSEMEQDFKREAIKQYLKYFRIWFIIAGVLFVIALLVGGTKLLGKGGVRNNDMAPAERVYDYAEVLTDEEEQKLRAYISEKEVQIQADIVLVTINEPMEKDDISWERAMMNYADDFYDEHNYGYDGARGNGVLLLDNYYEGQGGSWLSTCGNVYEAFGDYEINQVLDAVYYGLDDGAYTAYKEYVDSVCYWMPGQKDTFAFLPFIMLGSLVVALIYALIYLHQKKAQDTTQANTYVSGGKPVMNMQRDDFIRKNVVKRHIERSSSSGGGGGRGGSHRSSSGVSHGGGGRRR